MSTAVVAGTRLLSTFYLGPLLFGVDVLRVQEVIRYQRMTPVPLAPAEVTGLINLRGQIVTAIDLRKRLGLPALAQEKSPMNVVLTTSDGAVSLLVDEIGDVLEVEGEQYEQPPETLGEVNRALLAGVVQLEQDLLLVLDVEKAIQPPDGD